MARPADKNSRSETRRAAVYVRISDDQAHGWGVADQEAHCRRLAERLGWEVVDVYIDNDISISRASKKKRPNFDRLKQDIAAERVNAILVTESSRLFRREMEGLQFQEDYGEPFGLTIRGLDFTVDFITGEGVTLWKMQGVMDADESERTRRRSLRKELSRAEQGIPKRGGTRRFGFEHDFETVIPEEAALIQEAARRFLQGESLGHIARDWNERSIRTPGRTRINKETGERTTLPGNLWRITPLRRLLMNPHLIGYRDHHKAGLVRGKWEPIVDQVTWERLQVRFKDPQRLKAGQFLAKRYLLSGFLYCGLCGERMSASPRTDGVRTYICKKSAGYPGCGNIRRKADPVDNLIQDYIFTLIENTPEIASGLNPRSQTEKAVARLSRHIGNYNARLEELANDYYVEEAITREQFLTTTRQLERRIETCERERRRLIGGMALVSLGNASIRKAWEMRGLDWRRQLIDELIEKIIVHQVTKRGRVPFEPDKIEVVWRDRLASNATGET